MSPDDRVARGRLAYAQGRYEVAEKEFRSALIENPNDPGRRALLALALLASGRTDDAEREARAAIECDPESPSGYFAVARVLWLRGRTAEAREAAAEALSRDPWNAGHHQLLGQLAADRSEWTAALSHAEGGLAVDPDQVSCRLLRASALTELGRAGEAVAVLQETLADAPESASVHEILGSALLRVGRPKEAVSHLREALRLDPMSRGALRGFGEALKSRNFAYRKVVDIELWLIRSKRNALVLFMIFGAFSLAMAVVAQLGLRLPSYTVYFLAPIGVFALLRPYVRPVFDLTLQLDPIGRHALTFDERAASWCAALALACTGVFAALGLVRSEVLWALPAIVTFVFGIHAVDVVSSPIPRLRTSRITVLILTALSGTAGIAVIAWHHQPGKGFLLIGCAMVLAACLLFLVGQVLSSVADWADRND